MKRKNIFLIGPTGFGKSSFIKTFTQDPNGPRIGDARGYSTTYTTESYEFKDLVFFDTSGLGDAQLRKSDSQIIDELTYFLLSNYSDSNSLDCILVFESMQSDRMSLIKTIQSIQKIFGDLNKVAPSIIVVFTKFNLFSLDYIRMRVEEVEKECKKLGLKTLAWKSDYEINGNLRKVSQDDLNQQIQVFYNLLSQCPPVPLETVRKLKEEIERLAKSLEAAYLAEVEKRIIQLKVQRVEEYEAEVERQREKVVPILNERYEDVEKRRMETEYEIKTRQENVTVQVPVTVTYCKTGPGFFQKVFNLQKSYTDTHMKDVSIPVTKYDVIPHQVEKTFMDKELRYDVQYKSEFEPYMEKVTKYNVKDEMVDEEVEVTKSKPEFKFFYNEARRQVLHKLKETMKNLI